ncbi:MAG: sulfotransferase [Deltaproteobacteria bacterium]|nr:sulfotransferase [Deltaproteobacteria bacterium]
MRRLERPIIILGAARSGTKMVRGILAAHPRVSMVPWDVNFIWKFGHYGIPHDQLRPDQADPRTRAFIQRALGRFLEPGHDRLVEKTVGNTLRPEFVRAVFPDCQIIHLVRDGRAVAESSRRMWQAPMDLRAVTEKLRAFPLRAVPTYGLQYVRAYAERKLGLREGAVGTWGPRWEGIDDDVRRLPLLEVCARQWVRSVEEARAGLARLPPDCFTELRYEALIADPAGEAARLLAFLDLPPSLAVEAHLERTVTSSNLEKWQERLAPEEVEAVLGHEGSLLRELGYI